MNLYFDFALAFIRLRLYLRPSANIRGRTPNPQPPYRPQDAILTFGLLTAPHASGVEINAEVAKLADALA